MSFFFCYEQEIECKNDHNFFIHTIKEIIIKVNNSYLIMYSLYALPCYSQLRFNTQINVLVFHFSAKHQQHDIRAQRWNWINPPSLFHFSLKLGATELCFKILQVFVHEKCLWCIKFLLNDLWSIWGNFLIHFH